MHRGRSVPDATTTLSSGDRVGGYQILGLAGAGGMGVIYRALEVKLQRVVALKFLPKDVVATSVDKDRFLREARTASALDHPNIGVIHGIEEPPQARGGTLRVFWLISARAAGCGASRCSKNFT